MLITNKLNSLTRTQSLATSFTIAIVGSILLALLARLSIPVPFSPVPITGQTLGVLLLGGLLGSRLATITILTYIFEGAIGLPVFAGGSLGFLYLLGPTGGYLIGFIPAAYFIGLLSERGWNSKIGSSILAITLGTAIIFIFGVSWLSVTAGITNAISIGLVPYLPGAVVKISLATIILFSLNKVTKQ
jgi:biotin transport system substrate-specific component